MNQWTLRVDTVVAFVRTTQRQKHVDPAYKRYAKWKDYLRIVANLRGFPPRLDKRYVYELHTCVTWIGVGRPDFDNCAVKNVADALYPPRAGGDNRIKRGSYEVIDNHGSESLTVTLLEKASTTGRAGRKVTARREKDRGGRVSVPASTDPYSREFRRTNQRRDM